MTPQSLFLGQDNLGLCTDLYELTMAAAYLRAGVHERRAVFELHTRVVRSSVLGNARLIHVMAPRGEINDLSFRFISS